MTYAEETDLIQRFGEAVMTALADRDHDGTADPGVLEGALADASAEIDTYLQPAGYTLPLADPAPMAIVRATCEIARFNLYTDAAPETIVNRHDAVVGWLKQIAAGKIMLGAGGDGAEIEPTEDTAEISSAGNVFARGRCATDAGEASCGW